MADVYRERSTSDVELPFTARPGGAPANVAVAAARLGVESAFVGRVGDDLFGDFLLEALRASGVDTSAILRESPPTRTTLAFVEVSEDGEREFTFYRSFPAADELLAPVDIRSETLSGASFANFGSIPLIKEPARSATHRFAQLANEMDVAVAFDVNLRADLWASLDAFREAVEPMLDLSAVIKLNEDELSPVLATDDPGEAADRLLRPRRLAGAGEPGGTRGLLRRSGVPGRGTVVPARAGRGCHGRGGRIPCGHPRPPLGEPGVAGRRGVRARRCAPGKRGRRNGLREVRRDAGTAHA